MKTICVLLTCLLFTQSVFSQSEATDRELKVRNQIQKRGAGERSRVKVDLLDGTRVKGYISSADSDSFEITDPKTAKVTPIRYAEAKKVMGPGLSKGVKIGIVVGIAAGIAIAIGAAIASAYGELLEGL